MAQIWKSRKALAAICALALTLVAVVGGLTPAASLNLPLETPTVPVEAPKAPVKTPTVPVKTPTVPTVPVKVPTVPVKVPTVPVKVPTVPVKTPTVPVKTPTTPVKTTTAAKAPTVPVKTPPVSIKTPSVPVKTPDVNVKTPVGSVKGSSSAGGSSVSVATGSGSAGRASSTPATRDAAAAAGSSAGSAGSTSGGSGTSTSPLGTYAPGVGYGELPAIEGKGATSARVRARIARRERRLKATVERFQGCLNALPANQRTLLELRTGYGAYRPLSPRAAAARLHLGAAQAARLEKQAVHALTDAASTHDCSQTGAVVNGVMSFISAGFGGSGPQATGGVEAVRYESAPIKPKGTGSSTVGRILGADISPTASDVILILALLMALGTIVALVIADAGGQGPRHEAWRQRVVNRFRSLR